MNYTINIALLALSMAAASFFAFIAASYDLRDTNERLEAISELQAAHQTLLFSVIESQTLSMEIDKEIIKQLK